MGILALLHRLLCSANEDRQPGPGRHGSGPCGILGDHAREPIGRIPGQRRELQTAHASAAARAAAALVRWLIEPRAVQVARSALADPSRNIILLFLVAGIGS